MNPDETKAAHRLLSDTQQRFSTGVEGSLLQKLLPPDLYAALMKEIGELEADLARDTQTEVCSDDELAARWSHDEWREYE